jgi:hypothetical protein
MRVLPLAHQGVTARVRALIAPIDALALDMELSLEIQNAAAVATLLHAAPETALALMRVLPLAHQGVTARVRALIAPINALALDMELSLEIQIAAAVATLLHAAPQTALALMRVLPLAHQGVTARVRALIAPIDALALKTEMSLEIQNVAADATGNTAAPTLSLSPLKTLRWAKTVRALPMVLRLDQRDVAVPAPQRHSRAVAHRTHVTW